MIAKNVTQGNLRVKCLVVLQLVRVLMSQIKDNVKYHELSVLSNSWTQSYSFLIYLNKNIEYWGKH